MAPEGSCPLPPFFFPVLATGARTTFFSPTVMAPQPLPREPPTSGLSAKPHSPPIRLLTPLVVPVVNSYIQAPSCPIRFLKPSPSQAPLCPMSVAPRLHPVSGPQRGTATITSCYCIVVTPDFTVTALLESAVKLAVKLYLALISNMHF
jgi:hypothetical protein